MAKSAAPQQTISPAQQNALARDLVLRTAIEMKQSIDARTLTGVVPGQTISVPVRNVGLIKKFIVSVEFDIAAAAAETLTRSTFGPANILSQVVFTDLSNQTRVNTTGWHLHMLASARRASVFGAAYSTDTPTGFGSDVTVVKAPASVVGAGTQKVRMFYEIPLAYGDYDLRGAVYANVVNATAQLQLTVNPNLVVGSGASDVLAVYKSSSGSDKGVITNFKINTYQVYLDQLPMNGAQPILPMLDISTAYTLNNTAMTGLAASQDNAIPYANFREFMSTIVVFDQQGTLNAGSDVNFFALQAANYSNIFKLDAHTAALETRNEIGNDFPKGSYYFNHRKRPISTLQFGNMQLIVNPSSVAGAASQLLVGFEALALINMVTQAGSLPTN